jgi:hypothetical protein
MALKMIVSCRLFNICQPSSFLLALPILKPFLPLLLLRIYKAQGKKKKKKGQANYS